MKQTTKLLAIFIFAVISFFIFNVDFDKRLDTLTQKSELGSKDDPIKRAEYEFRMLRNPVTGKIPDEIRRKEVEFVKNILTVKEKSLYKGNSIQALNFKSRGPVNCGGRVRALAVDIRSTSSNVIIIAGGVSGGIWRSTDNGASWTQTSLPSQINSATCIAQDPRPGHQDTWYVGTGEAYGNSTSGGSASYLGDGIFKSTDNGLSWTRLSSTVSNTPQTFDNIFDFVHKIAVNPSTGTVYAAAINMILRSTDGGNSWVTALSTPSNATYTDVVATASGTIYAAVNSYVAEAGIWKSTNDGGSWTKITPPDFPAVYERVVIAVAPSDENRVYLLAYTPGSGKDGHGFWVSSDGGSSWTNATNNLPDTEGNVAGYSAQGGYNMVIAVKPDDPNFVVFGGTNLHRSTDGMASKLANAYSNWIGGYSVADDISSYSNHHPDQHVLFFAPFNSKSLYCGDDGGIQVTNDITSSVVSWNDINNGFITSQFYSISMDQATANDPILLGGLQDNGNYYVNSETATTPWVEMIAGGDGAFTAIANEKKYYYIETQNGQVIRLELYNSGDYKTWSVVKPNHETDYLFINPYVLDPNNSNIMYYVAGDSLWRNSDLSAIPNWNNNSTSVNWTCLTNTKTGDKITAVAASKNPANVVYYGTSDGQIYRLDDANVGNPTPTNIWSGKGLPGGYVSSIAIDPDNANNAIVVFSNYEIISLYYTSNGGSSWTAVAGNLEQYSDGSGNGPSCRWASILNYGGTTTYYVATSAGLYSTTTLNGISTEWIQEAPDEIGVAVCTMVKTRQLDGNVVVATHGAGVFSASASDVPGNVLLSENFDAAFPPSGWGKSITNTDNTWMQGNPSENPFSDIDPTSVASAVCPWVAQDQNELLYTPALLLPNEKITLTFYAGYNSTWLSYATLKLLISFDSGSNWTEVWTAPNDGTADWKWKEITVDLSQYANSSNAVLAWQYVGNDGDLIALDNVNLTSGTVDVRDDSEMPTDFQLSQNYPNPFNPSTTINYSIPKNGLVSLKIYNIRGELVSELVNSYQAAGNYSVPFNTSNLASGTYIYELRSNGNSISKKMLLLK